MDSELLKMLPMLLVENTWESLLDRVNLAILRFLVSILVKIITTGEGGMALTNDQKLYSRMKSLQSHGITRDKNLMTKKEEGEWYYEQTELGFNYRMTDIQAALGISQINRLDHFVNLRNNLSMIYDRKLLSFPILLPKKLQM